MMKILALLTPIDGKTRDDFELFVVAEEQAIWAAYRAGVLREFYYQPEPLTVSLLFEAVDVTEVETLLASFPMIRGGLLDIRTVILGPWTQLEALFDRANLTTDMQDAAKTRAETALKT